MIQPLEDAVGAGALQRGILSNPEIRQAVLNPDKATRLRAASNNKT